MHVLLSFCVIACGKKNQEIKNGNKKNSVQNAELRAKTMEDEIKEIAALAQESEEGVSIPEDAKPVTKEAIVLCGFDRSAAGELLEAIKRGKLKHVPLKAMLTPNNISWTLRTVLYELNEEHEQFKKMGSK